ncbi:MAG: choice-of-anchor tandem repeat GloVer-containing protein [Candidatus Sulfotelmatobacter sp.]
MLYNFTPANTSQIPNSRLTFDSSGNLYGTTITSRDGLYGTVFEVSPSSSGIWTEKTLHRFNSGNDGGNTTGNLVFDASGNLYGVTYGGGSGCNQNLCGVVYKLAPQSGGYTESIVHPFESAADGSNPYSGLFLDGSGNLYGTTYHGGSRYGYGTVYQITP